MPGLHGVPARRGRRALVTRLAAVALATSGGVTLGLALAVDAGAPAVADPAVGCTATAGTVTAVDFTHWAGGAVETGCDGTVTAATTEIQAMEAAGFTVAGTAEYGLAFVCRINDEPTPAQEPCTTTPGAAAYWSFWFADAGQDTWTYSSYGAEGAHPQAGSVAGWAFGAGSQPSVSPDAVRASVTGPTGPTTTVVSAPPTTHPAAVPPADQTTSTPPAGPVTTPGSGSGSGSGASRPVAPTTSVRRPTTTASPAPGRAAAAPGSAPGPTGTSLPPVVIGGAVPAAPGRSGSAGARRATGSRIEAVPASAHQSTGAGSPAPVLAGAGVVLVLVGAGGPWPGGAGGPDVAPAPGPVHGRRLPRALHPVAWWVWALGLATAVSRTTNPVLLVAALAVLGLVVANRRGEAPWARAFRYYLYLAGFVVVVRVGFRSIFGGDIGPHPTGVLVTLPHVPLPHWAAGVQLGGPVTASGTLAALYGGLQLGTLLCCVGAANALANPKRALRVLPGALHELGVAVVVALSVAPQLVDSLQRVRRARRLRGADHRGRRALRSLLVPVLEDALERSLRLAAAMDSRGYGRTGTASRRARRTTGALMLTGMCGLCLGAYGLLDGSSAPALGLPALVAGSVLCCGGLVVGGRRIRRTRYRPDPWRGPEWVVAGSGVVAAGLVLTGLGSAGLNPSTDPVLWPTLPLVPALAVAVAAVAAVAAPPPRRPAARGRAPVPTRTSRTGSPAPTGRPRAPTPAGPGPDGLRAPAPAGSTATRAGRIPDVRATTVVTRP